MAYAFCAWKFSFHFLNRGQQEQSQIAEILEKVGDDAYSAFSRLRSAMRLHSYNEGAILESIYRNIPIVEWLYEVRLDMVPPVLPPACCRRRCRRAPSLTCRALALSPSPHCPGLCQASHAFQDAPPLARL